MLLAGVSISVMIGLDDPSGRVIVRSIGFVHNTVNIHFVDGLLGSSTTVLHIIERVSRRMVLRLHFVFTIKAHLKINATWILRR